MSALLELDDLTIELPTAHGPARVLRGLDLTVEEGSATGIVGESGCGKTMSMMAVLGLLPPDATVTGELHFAGEALDTRPKIEALRGRRVAMVFQDSMRSLNPLMTVGAQVAEALRAHAGLGRVAARRAAVEALDKVGLRRPDVVARQYPHQLSGGMRQRVMIAAALACGPELLIADESTTGLDVTVQAQILDLLRDIREQEGLSLVFISHDLGAVAQVCDEIYVVYAGRAVEHGPTARVLGKPRHPYTVALLDALPRLGRPERLQGIDGLPPAPERTVRGCSFAPRCAHAERACREQQPPMVEVDDEYEVECWMEVGFP